MNRTKRRSGTILCGILTSIAALLPAQPLMAGAAASFVPASSADAPHIVYMSAHAVANGDTVNSHPVIGSYGWWNGGGTGTLSIIVYGDNNGQTLSCTLRAVRVSDGTVFAGGNFTTTTNGVFNLTATVTGAGVTAYLVNVQCNIPPVSGGKAARLYGF
jgi:hypothetical protein